MMTTTTVHRTLLAGLCTLSFAAAADQAHAGVLRIIKAKAGQSISWTFECDGELKSGQRCRLLNDSNKEYLADKKQRMGINLGFYPAAPAQPNVHLEKAGGGVINYGDQVALYIGSKVGGNGYLRYDSRNFGVDMSWGTKPDFQWRIDGGPEGTPVPAGTAVSMFNTSKGKALVHCVRAEPAANLSWDGAKCGASRVAGQAGQVAGRLGL